MPLNKKMLTALNDQITMELSASHSYLAMAGWFESQNLPGMAAYGASKAALRSFDEALAREARRKKIRVIDARPPHTETGLADHPIAGSAPKMPTGLSPAAVAQTICDAIDGDSNDLPAAAFQS